MSTTENADIPMPATMEELTVWIQRLNNAHARLGELTAARDAARRALDESFAVALGPHEAHASVLLDGIRAYIVQNLRKIKRHHGRSIWFGPSLVKFTVRGKSLTTVNDAEVVAALLANGLERFVRYEPRIDKVAVAAVPRGGKLTTVLREAGAYVSRNHIGTLKLPALENPIQLFKHRYPSVPKNDPND